MWGDVGLLGRCGEMWGDVGLLGRCGEMWGDVGLLGRCGEMWGDVGLLGRCGEMWACWGDGGDVGLLGRCGEMWACWGDAGRCGEMWGDVGRCGPAGEMRGDVGRCGPAGEMRGDVGLLGRCGEMWACWGDVGRCGPAGEMRGDVGLLGRCGEMWACWGDAGRCGEMWGDGGRCGPAGEMWGDVGRCGEMGGDVGRCGEMWGDVGRCGEMWGDVGRCGEMWGDVGLLVASDSLPHAGCVHGARATVEYVLHRLSPLRLTRSVASPRCWKPGRVRSSGSGARPEPAQCSRTLASLCGSTYESAGSETGLSTSMAPLCALRPSRKASPTPPSVSSPWLSSSAFARARAAVPGVGAHSIASAVRSSASWLTSPGGDASAGGAALATGALATSTGARWRPPWLGTPCAVGVPAMGGWCSTACVQLRVHAATLASLPSIFVPLCGNGVRSFTLLASAMHPGVGN